MEGSGDIIGGIMSAMWPSMTKMIEGEILKEVEGAINISVKDKFEKYLICNLRLVCEIITCLSE